jgi:hypothetical protein
VSLWVVDHPVEALARLALEEATALYLVPHPLQAVKELVADRLELADAGDPTGRPGDRHRPGLSDPGLGRLLGVGGERRLQPRDLAAQSPTGRAGVFFAGRGEGGIEIGRQGQLVSKRLIGHRARVERACEVTGVDPERARGLGRFSGNLLEGRRGGDVRQHEGPLAVARDDQPLVFEAPVDGAGGVDVDARADRQFAHTGQLVARCEPAAEDQRPQAPGKVDTDR